MRKISEGAEACIYKTMMLGRNAIIKYRVEKSYRVAELDSDLRERRTRNEAKIQAELYEIGVRVPSVMLAGRHFIVMNEVAGETLNKIKMINSGRGSTAIRIMSEAGSLLARIHDHGISHGDFTTANLMLDRNGRLWVIDFGLSAFTNSAEDKALDIILMKRSVGDKFYSHFIKGYVGGTAESGSVLKKLEEIERRGRYQTRTLSVG